MYTYFQESLARKIGLRNSEQMIDLLKHAEDETAEGKK